MIWWPSVGQVYTGCRILKLDDQAGYCTEIQDHPCPSVCFNDLKLLSSYSIGNVQETDEEDFDDDQCDPDYQAEDSSEESASDSDIEESGNLKI